MADKTVYKLQDIREIIKEQGYKYCNLTDLTGEVIVPYNSIKSPISKKLDEINNRMKRQPDGVYCITCKVTYGTNSKGDKYYLGKGKVPKTLSEENIPSQEKEPPVRKNGKENNSEHLLSLENFTETMRELAELKAKVSTLENENRRLKDDLENVEEYDDEEEGMDENTTLQGFGQIAKDLTLALEPVADRYFKNEERKLRLKEMQFLAEQGYEIPGAKRAVKSNGRAIRNGNPEPQQLPEVNGEGWEEYITHVLNLPEPDFIRHMEQLKAHDEDYYNAVCEEVYESEEEEEEEDK